MSSSSTSQSSQSLRPARQGTTSSQHSPVNTSPNNHDNVSTIASFWTSRRIFTALILFRCVNALTLRTFFQPDEYFQSLEPAWQMAFGDDTGSWITWEWHYQLRSSLHPALFAVVYFISDKILKVLQLSSHQQGLVLSIVPNLAQAVIAATGDFYTWKLASKVYRNDENAVWSALLLTVLSPWQWFCSTRTFSNCLETTLTVAALSYWPQSLFSTSLLPSAAATPSKDSAATVGQGALVSSQTILRLRLSLVLAAAACILRPTNALIWFCVVMPVILNLFSRQTRLKTSDYAILLREAFFCGVFVLAVSGISDRLYFNKWTFPPWQWLNFNISQDLAVFYGRNDWHYYLSQGLPLLLTTFLPFALIGMWKATSMGSGDVSFLLTNTVLVTIGILSLISHKEVRFIYPLLPLLHTLAAPVFSSFFFGGALVSSMSMSKDGQRNASTNTQRKPILGLVVILNIIIAAYTSGVHQRGVIDVTTFLRNEFESVVLRSSLDSKAPSLQDKAFVGFLMPCHSTPWRSKLVHPALKAWALGCEPPIHLAARTEERAAYRDEADRFYDDSFKFMRTELGTKDRPWPRYIAGFAGIEEILKQFVEQDMENVQVKERWRGKNSDWHDDWRRVGDVVVWELLTKGSV